MSETTDAKARWVQDVLGVGVGEPGEGKLARTAGPDGEKQSKGFLDTIKDGVVGAVREAGVAAGVALMPISSAELKTALDDLSAKIEDAKKLGFDMKRMTADHADLTKQGAAAEKITDDVKKLKALNDLLGRIGDMTDNADELLSVTKSVMGTKKGNPTDAQKSAIYKQAIKNKYSIDIKVPDGMKNTHFDKMFDMLNTLPKKDVKQEKFKTLAYSDAKDDKGSGAYYKRSGKIEMGDFGDASGAENYEIDGETIPANSFNVTALHEVGHAVDDKHGIMAKNGSKSGCGGWKPETVASAAAAFLPEVKKVLPPKAAVDDKVLLAAITTTLQAGTTSQPKEVDNATWKPILAYLTDKCLKVRAAASPWFAASPVVVDGRVYQEAYSSNWCSYEFAARSKTKVNGYQWRSPAEWFAEVYAISWLAKKKPPAGVDSSILEYMHKG